MILKWMKEKLSKINDMLKAAQQPPSATQRTFGHTKGLAKEFGKEVAQEMANELIDSALNGLRNWLRETLSSKHQTAPFPMPSTPSPASQSTASELLSQIRGYNDDLQRVLLKIVGLLKSEFGKNLKMPILMTLQVTAS